VKPVVIVGAGLSGLSAGVTLTSGHIPVLLLEQKPSPGGRAYSFTDRTTGDVVDNGQHLLIAGYERTLQFLKTIGTLDRLSIQPRPEILFHHPERGFRRLRLPLLPSPLHFVWGIMTLDLLSVADRLQLLQAGRTIAGFSDATAGPLHDLTVRQWLDLEGQSVECIRSFWEPLAVSIMNERIDAASAVVLVRSLRAAFLSGPRSAALAVATVGLSDLYADAAVEFIRSGGGDVRCGVDVAGLRVQDNAVAGVLARDGTEFPAAAVVLAVPSNRIAGLLPESVLKITTLAAFAENPAAPIVSIHLWFERDFMPHDLVGVIGRRVQWVFNRRRIAPDAQRTDGHVTSVISAAYDFVSSSNEDLVRIACGDLRQMYGIAVPPPIHALVIREKRATFSLTPAIERLRPDQRTTLENLFLAGDWTSTGFPATIEGAIVSGERCAALVAASLGDQKKSGGERPVAFL
jgi:squalene-associated FAD-dependent desaturase